MTVTQQKHRECPLWPDSPFSAMTALGWQRSLDIFCLSGSYAQIAEFAKFGPFPDSGRSCGVRRKPGESPTRPNLQTAAFVPMGGFRTFAAPAN